MARTISGIVVVCVLGACDSSDKPDAKWTSIAEAQPSALLSVWGSSATDVWVVGGDPRTGTGPIVEHYDGTAWTKLDTGQRNVDLWWVKGFEGGPVYMSGSGGTILRYENGTFTKQTTPGNQIVFGLWGASPDDMWAVGGNGGGGGGGFAWRSDGTTWTALADVPTDIKTSGTCWKVNGRAANDLWISGTNGATLHWNGSALERTDVPIEASLFSVAGNTDRFITVGGSVEGVIFENDGGGWKSSIPPGGPLLTGIAVSDDDAYAVGQFGAVLRRGSSGKWTSEKMTQTTKNLHAAWIDPDGGVWAVGGQFDVNPTSAGTLIHKGDALKGGFQ